jgi:hypothetical protein
MRRPAALLACCAAASNVSGFVIPAQRASAPVATRCTTCMSSSSSSDAARKAACAVAAGLMIVAPGLASADISAGAPTPPADIPQVVAQSQQEARTEELTVVEQLAQQATAEQVRCTMILPFQQQQQLKL